MISSDIAIAVVASFVGFLAATVNAWDRDRTRREMWSEMASWARRDALAVARLAERCLEVTHKEDRALWLCVVERANGIHAVAEDIVKVLSGKKDGAR